MEKKQSKENSKSYSDEEVKKIQENLVKSNKWDFYKEREFIENLLQQRFNFLLIIYSLFITAVVTVSGPNVQKLVLFLGVILNTLVALTVYRVYVKLIIYLRILYTFDNEVLQVIEYKCREQGLKSLFPVNKIVGLYIPLFCVVSLLLWLIILLIY